MHLEGIAFGIRIGVVLELHLQFFGRVLSDLAVVRVSLPPGVGDVDAQRRGRAEGAVEVATLALELAQQSVGRRPQDGDRVDEPVLGAGVGDLPFDLVAAEFQVVRSPCFRAFRGTFHGVARHRGRRGGRRVADAAAGGEAHLEGIGVLRPQGEALELHDQRFGRTGFDPTVALVAFPTGAGDVGAQLRRRARNLVQIAPFAFELQQGAVLLGPRKTDAVDKHVLCSGVADLPFDLFLVERQGRHAGDLGAWFDGAGADRPVLV